MRNLRTIENVNKRAGGNKGYTLIEVAIVVMIVGVLMVPALTLYNQKLKTDSIKETSDAVDTAETYVARFRGMYGRYPCPSPVNAVPGDADYGFEDCAAVAPGVQTAISNDTTLANRNILIGALPFRQMNLQEQDSYDGYGQRLTYAVTESLTDAASFDEENGGISIVDDNGVNALGDDALGNEEMAQFLVLSAGENGNGAILRDGVRTICDATLLDGQNCDDDETFMVTQAATEADDILSYGTSAVMPYWKYASATSENVILSDSNKFGVGNPSDLAFASASSLTVLEAGTDDAVILASGGAMVSNSLCDYNDAGCFSPNLVAGKIGSTGGMTCGSDQFMVGVDTKSPVCRDRITFSCPAGQFMKGINASGGLICDGPVAPGCSDENVPNSCGGSGTLNATFDSDYDYIESGSCYMLDSFSSATADSYSTVSDLENYVDGLNTGSRNQVTCPSDNLIRDNFQCDAGTWVPAQTHELWNYKGSFPSNPNYTGGYRVAETTAKGRPAYSVSGSGTANDCWCREDYRVVTSSCYSGLSGTRVRVQKHRCPQTRGNNWKTIYTDNSSYCTCQPNTDVQTESCSSYYGVSSGSMSGTVTTTYNNTCDGGGNVVTDPSPTVDTSDCTCPARGDLRDTEACPSGTTNSFNFDGKNYNDVQKITDNAWVCPSGEGNSVSGASDAGYRAGRTVVHTEACSCDSSLTDIVHEACPSGKSGPGFDYRREWDCSIPGWEPKSDWEQLPGGGCSVCSWKRSTNPSEGSNGIGAKEGSSPCVCGAKDLCYVEKGPNDFDNYTNCTCQP